MKTFIHTTINVDNIFTPVILAISTRYASEYKVFEMMSDDYALMCSIVFED